MDPTAMPILFHTRDEPLDVEVSEVPDELGGSLGALADGPGVTWGAGVVFGPGATEPEFPPKAGFVGNTNPPGGATPAVGIPAPGIVGGVMFGIPGPVPGP